MIKTKVNKHLETALNLVGQMIKVADRGVLDDSVDNGFYILYGIIRDNAYEIRATVAREYKARNLKIPQKYLTQNRN